MSPLKAILSKKKFNIFYLKQNQLLFQKKDMYKTFIIKKKLPWMIFQLKLKHRRLVDNISGFS